jgi:predicted RNase H-like nuclease (RuvC/YqgF family)
MKTINTLIDKIVELKVDLYRLENKNKNLTSEVTASKNIITNLKLEITNLRLAIESNNK